MEKCGDGREVLMLQKKEERGQEDNVKGDDKKVQDYRNKLCMYTSNMKFHGQKLRK